MRNMLLAAGAAIAALSVPALAQSHGGGPGGGGGPPAGVTVGPSTAIPAGPPQGLPPGPPTTIPPSDNANANASGQVQGNVNAQTDTHASDRAQERTGASVDHSATTSTDNDDATAASGAAAHVKSKTNTPNYGGSACPPGLAGRNPACVPPGLATKNYRVGEHLSGNFKYYTDLSAIPDTAKSQIPSQYQTNAYRYIYQTNRIYVVSGSTDKVVSVINLNP